MYVLDNEKKDSVEELEEDIKDDSQTEALNEEEVDNVEGNDENIDSEPVFQMKKMENQIKEQEEAFLRLNAEYSNFRRRTTEEKESIGLYANEKVMDELLPVIDNMERALDSFEDKENPLYKGVELVYKQMLDALGKAGLEVIPSEVGSDFDHNMHMAVMQEPSEEYEAGKITLVLQKGYRLGKKVLRASMVKVSN
ncbi:MAG: nucleotide exchange factor GrpE [Peptostreptococcus sp.]|uniref:nucleotide exchange factor GrpE n=1 Tax=Peptostreptococcus sp. TaxID=1262 RepID=UPI002FE6C81C